MGKDRIRILFVIDGEEFGGGERVFAQLINRLPREGYDCFVLSQPNEVFYRSIAGSNARILPVDFSRQVNPALFLEIAGIIREHRIAIINGQGGRADFYARIAKRMAGRSRYVSTVAMPVEGFNVHPAVRRLYALFDRFSERYVDRFVVVSDTLRAAMIRNHGLAAEKVVRVYNGIETDQYRPENLERERERIRRELSVKDGVLLIGAVGRLVWQKGFDYFLSGIPDLIRDLPDARFLLVGEGPLRGELERQAGLLNIGDLLRFTGQRSDIRDVMAALDIIVVPSLLEGFPMITLEAMAMERPIVATAIDGITEQIRHEEEGLLVPPRDTASLIRAVGRLARDPSLARTLGATARKRVLNDFSVRKMIEETVKVYETL